MAYRERKDFHEWKRMKRGIVAEQRREFNASQSLTLSTVITRFWLWKLSSGFSSSSVSSPSQIVKQLARLKNFFSTKLPFARSLSLSAVDEIEMKVFELAPWLVIKSVGGYRKRALHTIVQIIPIRQYFLKNSSMCVNRMQK